MDSLPKLDTSPEVSHSARNSYNSPTDSYPPSARSSYASISDTLPSSVRTSYSSLQESFARVSSFSRTSTSFVPESEESTPLSTREPSPDSPETWKENEEMISAETPAERSNSEVETSSHSRTGSKDGPSALKDLQNVRNVICVAFGAFDRYYISWEDNDGEFHQESHKLPECLYRWLFPPGGQTRHLPSLQVSLGSNDEFFASDKDGKLSSRDPSCQPGEKKAVPRLAEITRTMMRQKAHTVSSPAIRDESLTTLDSKPESPKLERRRTFQFGQDFPRTERKTTMAPLPESPQLTRLESKSKIIPIEEPAVVDSPNAESDMPKSDLPRQKSLLIGAVSIRDSPQLTRLESKPKTVPIEEPTVSERPNVRPDMPKIDHFRRKSLLLGTPPPVRPTWPKIQTLLTARESLQLSEKKENAPAKTTKYVDAGVQTEIEELPYLPQSFLVESQTGHNSLPPQHAISIGSMQDFCRGQYSLGDALRTYV